jgi:uncharacterized protein YecE (DUF72 family)
VDEQGKLLDEPPRQPGEAGRPAADGEPGMRERSGRDQGNVVVGTSGYSFDDWVGNFYPARIRKGDMLKEYSRHFNAVEVNSTYYRIPNAAVMARMEEKTPAGFEFVIKANQEMTHSASKDPALYAAFREAVLPVVEAGKFRGIIAQFPWRFKPTGEARDHLEFLRQQFPDHPLFVEFRNADWITETTFEALRAAGIGYCSVDEPSLKGLVPPIARLTTDRGYVRLHGRNAKNWWRGSGKGGGDRYDYLYGEEELKEWVTKIKAMARAATRTYVFFNNCHAGQAARNAKLMKDLLALPI